MENKILLIDDEADRGWGDILKHLFFENDQVDLAPTISKAENLLEENNYNLIFLDLRFGEKDHQTNNFEDFDGFRLVRKIRNNFLSKNFHTPVILFTASNKAWIINAMLDIGCDDYYIKEHPDTAYDESFTRNNTKRLKNTVINLLDVGKNRSRIWQKANSIIDKIEYTVPNNNIRKRIQEKLKIGYGLLFRKTSSFESVNLLYNNEVLAFIVFWSILEELSHSHYGRTKTLEKSWVLEHSNKKIQYLEDNDRLISGFKSIKDEFNSFDGTKNDESSHQVNLSNQISAILRYDLNWSHNDIRLKFLTKFNRYRNKIDFIHSDTEAINTHNIADEYDDKEAFNKCVQILNFIETLSDKANFQ